MGDICRSFDEIEALVLDRTGSSYDVSKSCESHNAQTKPGRFLLSCVKSATWCLPFWMNISWQPFNEYFKNRQLRLLNICLLFLKFIAVIYVRCFFNLQPDRFSFNDRRLWNFDYVSPIMLCITTLMLQNTFSSCNKFVDLCEINVAPFYSMLSMCTSSEKKFDPVVDLLLNHQCNELKTSSAVCLL